MRYIARFIGFIFRCILKYIVGPLFVIVYNIAMFIWFLDFKHFKLKFTEEHDYVGEYSWLKPGPRYYWKTPYDYLIDRRTEEDYNY